MHHSVLPEKGVVLSRGRSSSSRRALAREDWVAKRNPELARVRAGGRCPSSVISCSRETEVPFGRARPRFNVNVVGFGNVCCFRFGRAAKRNGAFAGRFCGFLRVAVFSAITVLSEYGVSLITSLACNQCTIPFCRKRESFCHEGGRPRQGAHWLVRTGLQNGIPSSPECALAGGAPLPLFPALARRRFRLASQCITFSSR